MLLSWEGEGDCEEGESDVCVVVNWSVNGIGRAVWRDLIRESGVSLV